MDFQRGGGGAGCGAGELDSQLMQGLVSNYLPYPSQGSNPPAHCPCLGNDATLHPCRRLGAGRERVVIGHMALGAKSPAGTCALVKVQTCLVYPHGKESVRSNSK